MFWGLVEMVTPCCIQNSEGQAALSTLPLAKLSPTNPAPFQDSSFHTWVGPFASWSSAYLWVVQLAQASCAYSSFAGFISWIILLAVTSYFSSPAQQCFCPQVRLSGSLVPYFLNHRTSVLSRVDIMLNPNTGVFLPSLQLRAACL